MKIVVIQSSPNRDGLTAACAAAAVAGLQEAGAEVEDVRLNDLKIGRCNCCGNGWGSSSSLARRIHASRGTRFQSAVALLARPERAPR